MTKHFLTLTDRTPAAYRELFARARVLKARRAEGKLDDTLRGKTLVLVFEKSSTRTRLSFEAAIAQLGGTCIDLPMSQSQLARGEPITDTAKVIAGYADAVVFRTHGDDRLAAYAGASKIPVINGLSDGGHPVQLLADLLTIEEKLGSIAGKVVAFVGDGATNMGLSFIEAAKIWKFELRLACPVGYQPKVTNEHVVVTIDPVTAVTGADVVVTDVWTSMGQEAESAARLAAFAGFCVDAKLMAHAKPTAIVLHCLPAHRGEEISADVIDGPQSVVFDEAENRMHAQKALLEDTIASPSMLSQFTYATLWESWRAHIDKDLLADTNAWVTATNQNPSLSINQAAKFTVVGMTQQDRRITVIAAQSYQGWYYAQSGSDWGEYHFRVVELTFEKLTLTGTRMLGETTNSVTENGDTDFDVAGSLRAFVDSTLAQHDMR